MSPDRTFTGSYDHLLWARAYYIYYNHIYNVIALVPHSMLRALEVGECYLYFHFGESKSHARPYQHDENMGAS